MNNRKKIKLLLKSYRLNKRSVLGDHFLNKNFGDTIIFMKIFKCSTEQVLLLSDRKGL